MDQTANFERGEFLCKHCGEGWRIVKDELLIHLQLLRDAWGKPMTVASGYRCPVHNAAVGGRPGSAHLAGEAADIEDVDGALKAFCTPEVLEKAGLWAEAYAATPDWIHLQIRPTAERIFKP